MGKASQWFRGLLGLKRHDARSPASAAPTKPPKEKRRWSFVKSYRDKDHHATKHAHGATTTPPPPTTTTSYGHEEGAAGDPTKHAIAVAAATAAVAEAAHAAAQAAAAVVRLTSSGRCAGHPTAAHVSGSLVVAAREEWAALRIQSAFRGCLARRALRALKGLVKLQALVRGHIERKRTTEWLQRMQALLRAQARARAGRAQISESSYSSSSKSSHFHHTGPATPEKFEHVIRSKSIKHDQSPVLKRNGSKSNARLIGDLDKAHLGWNRSDSRRDERSSDQRGCSTRTGTTDDEKNDKILEVDSGKPHFTKRKNLFNSSHHVLASDQYSHSFTTSKDSTTHHTVPSPSSCEVQSLSPLKFSHEVEDGAFYTADNSPQVFSASSRGGGGSKRSPFTPTKSDGSRSFLSGYSDHPNYMAFTESSRAKARSLSAPKQRPQYERSSSAKRYSESRSSAQKLSYLHANFASKAYPGSGRLDKLGMPVG